MSVPRVTTIHVDLEANAELCITPLSDMHIEGRDFDEEGFNKAMRERAALPNHRALLLGDTMDLVVPTDLRRWRASVQDQSIVGRDSWLNAAVDLAEQRLSAPGIAYDFIGIGNHEDEFLRRHGYDTVSVLADRLNCARGGYSGYIEYVIHTFFEGKEPVRRAPIFRILWHHGAWGGKSKGIIAAKNWFSSYDGFNCACYGHNHGEGIHRETKFRPGRGGRLVEYPVYFVNTGAWVRAYSDAAEHTHYAERKGYPPTTRGTPMIRVRALNHGGANRKTRGWALGYTVEC